jgi:hypothetical protein
MNLANIQKKNFMQMAMQFVLTGQYYAPVFEGQLALSVFGNCGWK